VISSSSSVVSSVSSATSSSSSAGGAAESIARGKALINSDLCSACHTDNNDGSFSNNAFNVNRLHHGGDSKAALAAYIDESMPPGANASKCDLNCATDIANYLWSLRSQGPATLAQTQAAVKEIKDLVTGLNADPDLFKKPAALLAPEHQAAYLSFAEGLKASEILTVNASNQIAVGSDMTHVLNALAKVLEATGIEFVGTIAKGILKNETGIVITPVESETDDGEIVLTFNLENFTYNACEKATTPCNVKIDLDLQMIGDAGGKSQELKSTLTLQDGYIIKVNKLSASKGDISIGVKPSNI
jgi:hypothetical protein